MGLHLQSVAAALPVNNSTCMYTYYMACGQGTGWEWVVCGFCME